MLESFAKHGEIANHATSEWGMAIIFKPAKERSDETRSGFSST